MADRKAILLQAADEITITDAAAPEFLLLYQKAVLLALQECGAINDLQYQLCIDRLISQSRKSTHSSNSHADAMIPARGNDTC